MAKKKLIYSVISASLVLICATTMFILYSTVGHSFNKYNPPPYDFLLFDKNAVLTDTLTFTYKNAGTERNFLRTRDDFQFIMEHSPDEWDEAIHKEFSCGQCGTYNSVYADGCSACGNKIANPFAERHWNIIKDSPEHTLI